MRQDEIKFRLAFDPKQPQHAIAGLSSSFNRLARTADRTLSKVVGGVVGSPVGMMTSAMREGGIGAIEAYGGGAASRIFRHGIMEQYAPGLLAGLKSEEQAIEAIAQRQEMLGRRGEGETDEEILQQLKEMKELYRRGLDARDRVERLMATEHAAGISGVVSSAMGHSFAYMAKQIIRALY